MPSPLGHSVFGALCARAAGAPSTPRWAWYGFGIFAANAADLDFLAGVVVGDINRYHRSISHSIVAAVAFGVGSWIVARWWRRTREAAGTIALLGALSYVSHLVLDALSQGSRGLPSGQPLAWPITIDLIFFPWAPIPAIEHGTPGQSLASVIAATLTWHNVQMMVWELAMLAPIAAIILLVSHSGLFMQRVRRRTG